MFYASSNVRMPLQTDSTYCTLIGLPAKNLSTFINETRYNANGKYTSYSHYCFVELCARYVDSLSLSTHQDLCWYSYTLHVTHMNMQAWIGIYTLILLISLKRYMHWLMSVFTAISVTAKCKIFIYPFF